MAEKKVPSRRATNSRGSTGQKAPARRVAPASDTTNFTKEQQAPVRRNDVIRCEKCGEDYSVTYKRCPFCDERPGSGIGGKKGGNVHPIQLIGLIVSMVLIITALFIVFKYVGPLILGDRSPSSSSTSASTSQSGDPFGSQSGASSSGDSGSSSSSGGDVSLDVPYVNVTALTLNEKDITLRAGELFAFTATVSPADAAVTWTSSDESILKIAADGTATNVNTSGSKVKVTVTATAGDKTAECTVFCNSGSSSTVTPSSGDTPSGNGSVGPNTLGKITNAGSGLNIRSGPGSSYEIIASAENGAEIIIKEDAGNGWYKIDYGNGKIGYVSSAYVSVR